METAAGKIIDTDYDICDMMSDGGWEQSGSNSLVANSTDLIVKFTPLDVTFVTTVEVPAGPLVVQGSVRCPDVSADYLYGGNGMPLTLYNRYVGSVVVDVSSSNTCTPVVSLTLTSFSSTTITMDPCTDEVVVTTNNGPVLVVALKSHHCLQSHRRPCPRSRARLMLRMLGGLRGGHGPGGIL